MYSKDSVKDVFNTFVSDLLTVDASNGVYVNQLPDDPAKDASEFIKLTEESRRERQRRMDAGDESVRIKFDAMQKQADAEKNRVEQAAKAKKQAEERQAAAKKAAEEAAKNPKPVAQKSSASSTQGTLAPRTTAAPGLKPAAQGTAKPAWISAAKASDKAADNQQKPSWNSSSQSSWGSGGAAKDAAAKKPWEHAGAAKDAGAKKPWEHAPRKGGGYGSKW